MFCPPTVHWSKKSSWSRVWICFVHRCISKNWKKVHLFIIELKKWRFNISCLFVLLLISKYMWLKSNKHLLKIFKNEMRIVIIFSFICYSETTNWQNICPIFWDANVHKIPANNYCCRNRRVHNVFALKKYLQIGALNERSHIKLMQNLKHNGDTHSLSPQPPSINKIHTYLHNREI